MPPKFQARRITNLASPLLIQQGKGGGSKPTGVEGNMKRMAKVAMVAVILAALAIGQSTVFAAPIRGAGHASGDGFFQHLLSVFAALWGGGHAAVWGGQSSQTISPEAGKPCAVWGGGC